MVRLHVTTTYFSPRGASVHTQVIEFNSTDDAEHAMNSFNSKSKENGESQAYGVRHQCVGLPGLENKQ